MDILDKIGGVVIDARTPTPGEFVREYLSPDRTRFHDLQYAEPYVEPAAGPRRTDLTANDFLDLFTPTEQAGFEVSLEMVKAMIAAGGTPNQVQAGLLVVDRRISSADAISLDDPRVAASLDILIAAGVIQAARKAEIVTGMPPA